MVKDKQYYYAPHRRMWGIWQHHDDGNGFGHGDFIKDCFTKEEARKEVYRLNNWKYDETKIQDKKQPKA